MLKVRSKQVNIADVNHFRALCQLEQCKSMANSQALAVAAASIVGLTDSPQGRNPFFAAAALIRIQQRRKIVETNLGLAASQCEGLDRDFPSIPMYRESLASTLLARGQLRLDTNRVEAEKDFVRSRTLLEQLAKKNDALPALWEDLGRSCGGLGLLTRFAGNEPEANKRFKEAADAFDRAVEQSPDNARLRRWRKELADLAR